MANRALDPHKYSNQKSYNGQPSRPGEVLVPFWCNKDLQLEMIPASPKTLPPGKKAATIFLSASHPSGNLLMQNT